MNKILRNIFSVGMAFMLILGSVSGTTAVEAQSDTDIDAVLEEMTQKEKFGQLIMPDFRHWTVDGKQVPLTEMNDEVGQVIADYKLGGVILFRENVATTEQTARLTDGMQKAVSNDIPLMITVDQEGGLVTRLQTGTNMPGNMALGATRDLELTREVARAIGEEVGSLGININFAPSIDVNSNYLNPVIGIRSFGSDADLVSEMGVAYITGLQDAKVAGAAKHFPGHGDTATDSHFGLPVVDKSLEEFKAVDLKPFRAAIAAGVDMLMTAHIVVPALDDAKIKTSDGRLMGTPATLSKPILTDLVRDEMNYDGIVITDALNMKAISDNFTEAEAAVTTIAAGSDIALMPTFIRKPSDVSKLDEIYEALQTAVDEDVIPQEQIDKSVHRVLTLKKNREILDSKDMRTIDERVADAKQIVGSAKHKEVERRAAEKAITLIKNEGDMLPFKLSDNKSVLILSSAGARANSMELELNSIIEDNMMEGVDVSRFIFGHANSITDADKARIDAADFIVMESMNLSNSSKYAPEVVAYANETDAKYAVMSTRNPYDIMFMEDVKANIAVYGSSGYDQTQQGEAALPINIPVGMSVIFGEARPGGKLPVTVPKLDGSGTLYEFGHGLSFRDAAITTDLEDAILEGEAVVEADYTVESYADLATALAEGHALLDMLMEDPMSATQEEVTTALLDIYAALDALEEATPIVDYNTALAALRKADSSRNSEDITLAKDLANGMVDGWQKNRIVNRLNVIEAQVIAAAKYAEAEEAVRVADASRSKEDIASARMLIEALDNGVGKDRLMNRLVTIEAQVNTGVTYEEALTALRTADGSRMSEDIEIARDLASKLLEGWQKNRLVNRLAVIDAQEA